MAAKKAKKSKLKATLPSRKRKAASKESKPDREPVGDHVRSLAPKDAVRTFIKECIAAKNRTSTVGQEKSSAAKRAAELGVDVPAAMIGSRIISKAQQDSLKGRVLWDNVKYYVDDCMEFDKIAPPGLFAPDEMRSTKKEPEPEQMDLPTETVSEQVAAVH